MQSGGGTPAHTTVPLGSEIALTERNLGLLGMSVGIFVGMLVFVRLVIMMKTRLSRAQAYKQHEEFLPSSLVQKQVAQGEIEAPAVELGGVVDGDVGGSSMEAVGDTADSSESSGDGTNECGEDEGAAESWVETVEAQEEMAAEVGNTADGSIHLRKPESSDPADDLCVQSDSSADGDTEVNEPVPPSSESHMETKNSQPAMVDDHEEEVMGSSTVSNRDGDDTLLFSEKDAGSMIKAARKVARRLRHEQKLTKLAGQLSSRLSGSFLLQDPQHSSDSDEEAGTLHV